MGPHRLGRHVCGTDMVPASALSVVTAQHTCLGVRVDAYADMCVDISSVDIYSYGLGSFGLGHVCRHLLCGHLFDICVDCVRHVRRYVFGHLCRHVCRYLCRHLCRHVC